MGPLTPRALLAGEGYELVLDPAWQRRPDVLGDPGCCVHGVLLTERRFAAAEESWDMVFGAAHEIAHARALDQGKGWEHDESLWVDQAEILARWLRRVGHPGAET